MDTDTTLSPEQRLAVERMECVCRTCRASPSTNRRRSYCTSCGKPRAWTAGTVALSRPEALIKARDDERARCVAIVERFTDESHPGPVQFAARRIIASIAARGSGESAGECSVVDSSVS